MCMPLKVAAVAAAALLATAGACDDQASPGSLMPGNVRITKHMLGFWSAPGGSFCTWSKQTKPNSNHKRVTTASGKGTRSQTVGFYTSDVDGRLSSDGCGTWKR